MTSKAVSGREWKLKSLGEFRLDEDRCSLVALVRVLFVDGGVVLLRLLAALYDDREQLT
jgi:hypothetical protein